MLYIRLVVPLTKLRVPLNSSSFHYMPVIMACRNLSKVFFPTSSSFHQNDDDNGHHDCDAIHNPQTHRYIPSQELRQDEFFEKKERAHRLIQQQ